MELDRKSFQLMVFLALCILFLLLFGFWRRAEVFHPVTPIEWCFLGVYFVTVFCLICAWGHALLTLKMGMDVNSQDTQSVHRLLVTAKDEQEDCLSEIYTYAIDRRAELVDAKQLNLYHAYSELTISAWLFMGGVIVALLIELGV